MELEYYRYKVIRFIIKIKINKKKNNKSLMKGFNFYVYIYKIKL